MSFLVRAKEDMIGQQKLTNAEDHFAIKGVRALRHGILWHLQRRKNITDITDSLLTSYYYLIPYAHDCYHY